MAVITSDSRMIRVHRTMLASLAVAAIAGTLAVACTKTQAFTALPVESGSLNDSRTYAKSDLARLEPGPVINASSPRSSMVVGDLIGNAADEIVLVDGNSTRLFDPAGRQVGSFELTGDKLAAAFVSDVTRDGKGDVIYGAFDSTAAVVEIRDGFGNLVSSTSYETLIRGDTRPAFVSDGLVYFTAASIFHIGPRIVGRIDAVGGGVRNVISTGPSPTAVALGSDGRIAVSNRGVDREKREFAPPVGSKRTASSLLVYEPTGATSIERMIGAPAKEGYFVDTAASRIVTKFLDVDSDGEEELLVLTERISELYGGPAEFSIVSADGSTVASMIGDEGTDGSFGFYREGNSVRIILAWSRSGRIVILDEKLTVVEERAFEPAPHDVRIWKIGDFDGDGGVEFLVSDERRVHLLDRRLGTIASFPAGNTVRSLAPVKTQEGTFALAVLAGELRLYVPGSGGNGMLEIYTSPPGATVAIDGEKIAGTDLPIVRLPAGKHTLVASVGDIESERRVVEVREGNTLFVDLDVVLPPPAVQSGLSTVGDRFAAPEVPSVPAGNYGSLELTKTLSPPSGYGLYHLGDYLSTPGTEFLFASRRGPSSWMIYDSDYNPAASCAFPVGTTWFLAPGDIDGDGYADLVPYRNESYTSFAVMRGDGRLVVDKPILPGLDTGVSLVATDDDSIYLAVTTGYLLFPRGAYGIERGSWNVDWFYPTASMVNSGIVLDGMLHLGCYTASNGAEMVHPNGSIDRDTEVFIHVVDPSGNPHPQARPMPGDDVDGGSTFLAFDSDGDGVREAHFFVTKDTSYYTGDPNLYRFDRDGSITLAHRGTPNNIAAPLRFDEDGTERLSLQWLRPPMIHEIIGGPSYEVLYHYEYTGDDRFFTMIDLDADGEWEILERVGGVLRVVNRSRAVLALLATPADTILSVWVADLDSDGTTEIIATSRERLYVFSY